MATLAEQAHRNLCDFWRWMPHLHPGGRYVDHDGVVGVAGEVDFPVDRTAVRDADDDRVHAWVEAAEAFLFADGKTGCVIARVGVDDEVTELLTQHGFAELATMPEMVCDGPLEPRPDPPGYRVRLATTAEDVLGYAAAAGEAFAHLGMPAERTQATLSHTEPLLADEVAIAIAEDEHGAVVAGALSVVVGEARNAYVSWVSCTDAARGHGLGDAVTRRATNEGFARGARLLTLEASPYGRNTYDRMGYQTLYDYRLLIKA